MLQIKNLKIWVEEKIILENININFEIWKNYLLVWKNWSWKSSLANFLMWNPKYKYIEWNITLEWENLLNMTPDERSLNWLFLCFQNIPEIPWIKLSEYLRIIYNNKIKLDSSFIKSWLKEISPFIFKRLIQKYLIDLDIPENFLQRELNVWFSWWEKRKIELLQTMLLNPKYIILDEIDSWLDLDSFKKVLNLITKINNTSNSIIIITHNFDIINYLNFDKVFLLEKWQIIQHWWLEIIENIKNKWY